MKKFMFAIATIAFVAAGSTFTSCKKGENDPFMSFRGRKGRLANSWTLKEGSSTQTGNVGGTSSTTTTTYTATERTTTTGGIATVYTIGAYSMTIEKDGTFDMTITETLKSVDGVTVTGAEAATQNTKGVWAFLGKNKDQEIKNKEGVVWSVTQNTFTAGGTSSTDTYTGVVDGSIWMLDQLKNKEMIATVDWTETDSDGDTWTYTSTMTYEGE